MSLLGTPKKRLLSLVVAVAVVAAGGGLAYAFWTATGTGTGAATTGTSTDFTVTSDPATGAPLTPGGASQSVAFTVANTGTASQDLSSVVVTVADATGNPWTDPAGCSSADYTVGTPDVPYGELAGNTSVDGTVTVTMKNLATNQDDCQGVTVPLYFAAS
jgi:hypothetical protein